MYSILWNIKKSSLRTDLAWYMNRLIFLTETMSCTQSPLCRLVPSYWMTGNVKIVWILNYPRYFNWLCSISIFASGGWLEYDRSTKSVLLHWVRWLWRNLDNYGSMFTLGGWKSILDCSEESIHNFQKLRLLNISSRISRYRNHLNMTFLVRTLIFHLYFNSLWRISLLFS